MNTNKDVKSELFVVLWNANKYMGHKFRKDKYGGSVCGAGRLSMRDETVFVRLTVMRGNETTGIISVFGMFG